MDDMMTGEQINDSSTNGPDCCNGYKGVVFC